MDIQFPIQNLPTEIKAKNQNASTNVPYFKIHSS